MSVVIVVSRRAYSPQLPETTQHLKTETGIIRVTSDGRDGYKHATGQIIAEYYRHATFRSKKKKKYRKKKRKKRKRRRHRGRTISDVRVILI